MSQNNAKGNTLNGIAGGDLSQTYPNPYVIQAQNGEIVFGLTYIKLAADMIGPAIYQDTPAGTGTTAGQALALQAQNGQNQTGGANNNNGGNLDLYAGSAGTGGGGTAGVPGVVNLHAGNTGVVASFANGVITFTGFGTGLVHSGSSGILSSSLAVNADISATAAIAVSKLAAGTSAQVLLNNATPTPTWTTLSGDATVDATGTVTVRGLRGKTISSALSSIGASQDGYALTWDNADGYWRATPAASSGLTAPVVGTTTTKTSGYTITTSDYIIFADTSGGAWNLTLPTPVNGNIYVVKDIKGTFQSNNLTLVRHGSEKIDGVAASRVLATNWGGFTITSNGTDWFLY